MSAQLLEVDARAVKFICEVKKQSTCSVHLSNVSDQYVAFKVKTTSPKKYCVRPNIGIINPKSTCDFTVTMQPLWSAPSDMECKDKFLIQSTVVDSGTSEDDITLDMFSKGNSRYVEEKKLRVILIRQHDSPVLQHQNKDLEQEPSNESVIKEENLANRDELFSLKHMQTEDVREVKNASTTEELKLSGDRDGNELNLSKNRKFNPVKDVKQDTGKMLKLCNEIKELQLKGNALEHQLKEAKSTISNLTYQNSIIIEAKGTLEQELARRSKKGFSFLFVCLVSLIGVTSGYLLHP